MCQERTLETQRPEPVSTPRMILLDEYLEALGDE
jgi:hypothetical protein